MWPFNKKKKTKPVDRYIYLIASGNKKPEGTLSRPRLAKLYLDKNLNITNKNDLVWHYVSHPTTITAVEIEGTGLRGDLRPSKTALKNDLFTIPSKQLTVTLLPK